MRDAVWVAPDLWAEVAYRGVTTAGELQHASFKGIAIEQDAGPDLLRREAMGRFHVRRPSGELLSGAAAFAGIWRVLPGWRFMDGASRLPGAIPVIELSYRALSPFRPTLARIVGRFTNA